MIELAVWYGMTLCYDDFLPEIEVKLRWARLVHGWMTVTEVRRTVRRPNAAQKPLSNNTWC